jgi:cyclase
MVTSIDQDGTKKGFDMELVKQISALVSIPVIASGGAGKINHISAVANETQLGAVAVASLLHYNLAEVAEIKKELNQAGIAIRV